MHKNNAARWRMGWAGALAWVASPFLAAPPVAATEKPSTKEVRFAFRYCLDMEKQGDALSCWKLFLDRYRTAAHEAQVLLAEERVNPPAAAPVRKPPAAAPVRKPPARASTKTSAEPKPPASEPGLAPDPYSEADPDGSDPNEKPSTDAEHSPKPEHEIELEELDEAETEDVDKPAAKPVRTVSGSVLDFCALAPRKDSKRFVKQRVVVFAPADTDRLERDPVMRRAGAAAHARSVFLARFPLARFYNVLSSIQAPAAVLGRDSVTLEQLASAVGSGSGSEDSERRFVVYSLRCSDYVVMPAFTDAQVKWEEREVKNKDGSKTKIKTANVKLSADLAIFKRSGSRLRRVAQFDANVPGLLDMATDVSSAVTSSASVNLGGVNLSAASAITTARPRQLCQRRRAGRVLALRGGRTHGRTLHRRKRRLQELRSAAKPRHL